MNRVAVVVAVIALAACEDGDALDCPTSTGNAVSFDTDAPPCRELSSYRFFSNGPTQVANAGVVGYTLNTPLFSDYSDKRRFIWLPPGTAMTYREGQAFGFPVGAVILKTFSYPERLLETRLLAHRSDGWRGYTYVWNEEQTEAIYTVPGAVIDTERGRYLVPNLNECKQCHQEDGEQSTPLGPKARHLNQPGQLSSLVGAGLLDDAPLSFEDAPRAAVWNDPSTGTIDARARAYLDINCAHCHNPSGRAGATEIDLRASQLNPRDIGVCKTPTAAGLGSGGREYAIVPGAPDDSFMVYRLESDVANIRMPELGRGLVHTEAVTLIRDWISQMNGACE